MPIYELKLTLNLVVGISIGEHIYVSPVPMGAAIIAIPTVLFAEENSRLKF